MDILRRQYVLERKKTQNEDTAQESQKNNPPQSPSAVTDVKDPIGGSSNNGDDYGVTSTSSHETYALKPMKLDVPIVLEDDEGFVGTGADKQASNSSLPLSDSSIPSLSSIHPFDLIPRHSSTQPNEGGSNAHHQRSLDLSTMDNDEPQISIYNVAVTPNYHHDRSRNTLENSSTTSNAVSEYFSSGIPPPPLDLSSPALSSPIWKKLECERTRQGQLRKRLDQYKSQP
jgi:hypothetical protein